MEIPPIVCISTIDWDFLWQRHQIFMRGFSDKGLPVLYVENLGGRSPSVKDWEKILQRLRNLLKQQVQGNRQLGGITILTPKILPLYSITQLINQQILIPKLAEQIKNCGFSRPVVWTYSPTPNALKLIDFLNPSAIIYDCVASVKGYAYTSAELIQSEKRLVRQADLIITDAQTLFEEKSLENPKTYRIPPGVDFDHFSKNNDTSEPGELSAIQHPRLCFFGTLGWWVDYDILCQFAVSHPEWAVVLIGPEKVDSSILAPLKELKNCFFLGTKRHTELPSFLRSMDVLCIPYKVDEFTRGVIPSKLYECLATGKPVISTPITEMMAYQGLISIADQTTFNHLVEQAHFNDTENSRKLRIQTARDNSWETRINQAYQLLVDTIESKRIEGSRESQKID